MKMLDASDAIATSTNLMNRLPTWVRSLYRTDVTILGSAEVMCFLGFAGGRWNHPVIYNTTGATGSWRRAASGLARPRYRDHCPPAGNARRLRPGISAGTAGTR